MGEKKEIDQKNFSEASLPGRKLYENRFDKNNQKIQYFRPKDLDWPFPDKWYQSIGFAVSGFTFELKNAPTNIKNKLDPQDGLINVENNLENAENNIKEELFFPSKKVIEEKIAEYNAILTKKFINESYFLYDKSNLIKKTFITAINKQLSLYGSFSYFSGKTAAINLELSNLSDFLKFLIKRRSLKSNITLQLLNINGSVVKRSDKKIHDFLITKLGKKRKNSMHEPIETILIRAQQNFEVVGGLNLIQIEIEDDRIINTLKKYKNIVYKITPLGLLFPATVTNNTNQIFIMSKELNGVKKKPAKR